MSINRPAAGGEFRKARFSLMQKKAVLHPAVAPNLSRMLSEAAASLSLYRCRDQRERTANRTTGAFRTLKGILDWLGGCLLPVVFRQEV